MLSQEEANSLIEYLKEIKDLSGTFPFPRPGEHKKIDLISSDGKYSFIVDVNRKGYINFLKKCTYQGRYQKDVTLLRLDIDGPENTNPDGCILPRTQLHIYREGFGDRFAIAVPPEIKNTDDLIETLIEFLEYFSVSNTNKLEIETVI